MHARAWPLPITATHSSRSFLLRWRAQFRVGSIRSGRDQYPTQGAQESPLLSPLLEALTAGSQPRLRCCINDPHARQARGLGLRNWLRFSPLRGRRGHWRARAAAARDRAVLSSSLDRDVRSASLLARLLVRPHVGDQLTDNDNGRTLTPCLICESLCPCTPGVGIPEGRFFRLPLPATRVAVPLGTCQPQVNAHPPVRGVVGGRGGGEVANELCIMMMLLSIFLCRFFGLLGSVDTGMRSRKRGARGSESIPHKGY